MVNSPLHFEVVSLEKGKHGDFEIGITMTPSFAMAFKKVLAKGIESLPNRGIAAMVCAIEGQLGRSSESFVAEPRTLTRTNH